MIFLFGSEKLTDDQHIIVAKALSEIRWNEGWDGENTDDPYELVPCNPENIEGFMQEYPDWDNQDSLIILSDDLHPALAYRLAKRLGTHYYIAFLMKDELVWVVEDKILALHLYDDGTDPRYDVVNISGDQELISALSTRGHYSGTPCYKQVGNCPIGEYLFTFSDTPEIGHDELAKLTPDNFWRTGRLVCIQYDGKKYIGIKLDEVMAEMIPCYNVYGDPFPNVDD
jgi:hypothetical protein